MSGTVARQDLDAFTRYEEFVAARIDSSLKPREIIFLALAGIFGEGGELIDPLKKQLFHVEADANGHRPLKYVDPAAALLEAGDLLWYVVALMIGTRRYLIECANAAGDGDAVLAAARIGLAQAVEANVEKLTRRYPEGFTYGGGLRGGDDAK